MTPTAHRDTLVFMQSGEPGSLFCADESDGEALRACEQTMEPLYSFEENGTAAIPALATDCSSNEDLTVWTCTLRENVTFQDGATFEAKDVLSRWPPVGCPVSAPHWRNRCVLVLARPVGRLPEPARTVRHRGSGRLRGVASV